MSNYSHNEYSSVLGAHVLESAFDERPRPFGSDFPARNPIYMMYLPLLLTLCGLIAWLFPTNATFVLSAIVGSLAVFYIVVDIVFRDAPLRLSLLAAMALLVGYNLGSLNSWLTVPRGGLTVAEYFTRDPAAIARAAGASLGAAALLLVLGQLFERPLFGMEFRIPFGSRSVVLILMSTALVLVGYATGGVGYMGVTVDDNGHISPLAALIIWWSAPAFAYSVCATLNLKGPTRWLVGGCTLLQTLALIPVGRRNFAYAILLAFIATRLGRYRSSMSLFKKLLVGGLAVALIIAASVSFLYLRVAGWGHKGATSLGTRLSLALDTLQKRSPAEVAQLLQSDASTRTFDLGYFSDLLDASQRSTPLMGRDLLHNLQLVIPSAISANKFGLDPYGEEEMVDMKWGFGYVDEANSLVTAGAADFGIIGVLIYPLLAVWLLRMTLEWLQSFMPTYGAVQIALAFISQMLIVEQLPAGSLVQVRNSLIFAAVLYVLSNLPKFQLRSAGSV